MSEKSPHYVTMVLPTDPPAYSPPLCAVSPVKKSSGRIKTILITMFSTLMAVVLVGGLVYLFALITAPQSVPLPSGNPVITFVGYLGNQVIYEARNMDNELVFINSARGTLTYQDKLVGESDLGGFAMGPLAHLRLVISVKGAQFRRDSDTSPLVWGNQKISWILTKSDGVIIKFEDERVTSNFK